MSFEELAELVDVPAEELKELTDAGLLDPDRRGSYDELDLLRIMAVRHHAALGHTPSSFAAALSSGEVEPYLGEYIFPRGPQLSIADAARKLAIDRDELVALRTALGFTREAILEGDLELFQAFHVMTGSGMPFDAVLEGARVFGDALRRLAETETRLVHVHMHERLEVEGIEEEDIIRQIEGLQQAVIPLLDTVVQRVHHEHLLMAAIEDAYVHLVDTERDAGIGSVDATIAFIDIESFTELAEAQGDQAAIETITRVDSAVRGLALEHGGKVVKQIGDALMLAFREPSRATRFAVELDRSVRGDESMPALRVGIHCGPAIYRAGDYFGATVNTASRVTSQAGAGETLVTEAVADHAGDGLQVESVGVRLLRGMEQPLTLYRLSHPLQKRDPVCGKTVKDAPVASLHTDGEELWFCSKDCLRSYLDAERDG